MAQAGFKKPPNPVNLETFLGTNESVGETEIKLGEMVKQENFRVTKNFKLDKRLGFNDYIVCPGAIRGVWHGVVNDKSVILFATGGVLYERNLAIETAETDLNNLLSSAWDDSAIWDDSDIWDESVDPPVKAIGAITDTETIFFYYGSVVYIKAGLDYKTYNGTTYANVAPYIPTISVGGAPDGTGAVPFEEINLLSGQKTISRVGNGTATNYTLPEQNIAVTAVTATVNGVAQIENTNFTVNRVTGIVTFNIASPSNAVVTITWDKVTSGNRELVLNHKYAVLFGVENDTDVFFFGGTHERNVYRFSMVGKPNYFPASTFVKVGSNEYAITALKPQYQSLIVFKAVGAKIVKPQSNPNYTTNKGLTPFIFPYFDLNEAVGNIAPNMVQLVENSPVSLYGSSVWSWASETGVEDERNAKIISDRYKISLAKEDLTQAVTYDWQEEKELWISVGGGVYIWNYGNNTWYKYTNASADYFITISGVPYFASNNKLIKVDKDSAADNGSAIPCVAYTGFSDFGQLQYRKGMRQQWVSINPAPRTSATITFITDREDESISKSERVEYRFLNFNDVDFNDFPFISNGNPQSRRIKAKIKKFTYLQIKIENNTNNETLTFLKLAMQAQTQGYSK